MAEKEEKKVGFAEEAAPGPKDRNRAVGAVQAHLAEQNLESRWRALCAGLTDRVTGMPQQETALLEAFSPFPAGRSGECCSI